jgi:periplasmic protein TonB
MRSIIVFVLLLFSCSVIAQKNNKKVEDDENKIFEKIELDARPDQKKWLAHMADKSKLTDAELKSIPAGTYTVKVRFVVDVHGNLGQIEAKNDPGHGLAKKAENIVRTYPLKWIPASQCGRLVKAYRHQSIVFEISDH